MKCFVCRKEIPPEDDQLLHWTEEIKIHMACGLAAKMLAKIADMRQKLIDTRAALKFLEILRRQNGIELGELGKRIVIPVLPPELQNIK